MADTWETLKSYIKTDDDDDTFVERCFDDATVLVNKYIGDNYIEDEIRDLAILKTGAELYSQRDAPGGISQFSDVNSNPIRVARDPLIAAMPLLRNVSPGIA